MRARSRPPHTAPRRKARSSADRPTRPPRRQEQAPPTARGARASRGPRMRNSTRSLAVDSISGRYAAITAATRVRSNLPLASRRRRQKHGEGRSMQIQAHCPGGDRHCRRNRTERVGDGRRRPGHPQAGDAASHRGAHPRIPHASPRHWPSATPSEAGQAESAPVVSLVSSGRESFNWSSALIRATAPLALLLAGLARPALTRHRTRTSALA